MRQILGDVLPGGGHIPLEVSTLIAPSLQVRKLKLWEVQTQCQGPGGAGGQTLRVSPRPSGLPQHPASAHPSERPVGRDQHPP